MGIGVGWILGVTPTGIAAVGPEVEIAIQLDANLAGRAAIIDALADEAGSDKLASIAEATPHEAQELIDRLRDAGALSGLDGPDPPEGWSLASALVELRAGRVPSGVIWTAEEALLIPEAIAASDRERVLRAFVAGLRPDARLQAHALLLAGHGLVRGDCPDPAVIATRVRAVALEADEVVALELTQGGKVCRIRVDDIDRIGAHDAHRFGPIVRLGSPRPLDPGNPVSPFLCVADVAVANLDFPTPAIDRRAQGIGHIDEARLIARAESAERYAAADVRRVVLVRARAGELEGALDPRDIYALSRRQEPGGPSADPGLWCSGETARGVRRWVPAEAVYTTLVDPLRSQPLVRLTGSGVAAHTDPDAARARALCELIERDACMWTWVQRVSRERIGGPGLPKAAIAARKRLADSGWAVHWVNLSLETFPVVLCCAIHPQLGLTLGAACDADPAAALLRATNEALAISLGFLTPPNRIDPTDVRGPVDHLRLHRDPARRGDHEFLFTSDREVALNEIPQGEAESPLAQLEAQGVEPVFVDLSGETTQPFTVIRALAPGLVPLTFGYDREPFGLPRLAQPRFSRAGQQFGALIDLEQFEIILPHPFS
jgi:ribosomal protein S12 methylthiotransferase accessory factor